MMNVLLVKHNGCDKNFAFSVSDELASYIRKDDQVIVKTMRGIQLGTAVTGIIKGDGAVDIAISNGAYLPLKPVIGVIPNSIKEAIRNEIVNKIIELIKSNIDINDIPF
jgi:hypothetical protein